MMYYIESPSTDPRFNLALEQYVFDVFDPAHEYFMLWRNHNAVIVGKFQNTAAEINASYVKENGISVVRRLSGGGAVYHDLGNVNFTFIVRAGDLGAFDFASFCRPVVRALASLGVRAEINGRNDMTIGGKKFSGNAQYYKRGRIMHHGTILYDSDLSVVGRALAVSKDKIESKGVKSVQSRITNVKSHMREEVPVEGFMAALREAMFLENSLLPHELSPEELLGVRALQRDVYDTWEWNYGASPPCSIRKERRVEGCGKLEIHMNVERGVLADIAFFGDYFGREDPAGLASLLRGRRLERGEISSVLAGLDLDAYFHNLDAGQFLDILMGSGN
ncbi:MAG: lipoate--protein ligase [Deltaproteobacteria bacterium]|jgi:lipoate-protein ligase A|nr:lipoate--protein ligase [Deltaproteobacteria bacterium]